MTNEETHGVLQFLNASWAHKPIDPKTAAIWGAELRAFEFGDVMQALRALLRTSKWRPSLAEIIGLICVESDAELASEAFAKVWKEIGRVGRGGVPNVSERALRAVGHLGGWVAVCSTWTIDQRTWHQKAFCKEFEDLETRDNRQSMRALSVASGSGRKELSGPRS